MTQDEKKRIEGQFDAFCKKVMKNALKDCMKRLKLINSREVLISSINTQQMLSLCVNDEYDFSQHISAYGYIISIRDEHLEKAILKLEKRCRDVILLRFWENMNDKEISRVTEIPRRTVQYLRHKALKQLRTALDDYVL